MATVIRMRRGGRTHAPYYRIVVQDSRSRDRGPEVDTLGVYHPCARPEPKMEVDVQKAVAWLEQGAQCSDTARSVLRKLGVFKAWKDGVLPEGAAEGRVVLKGAKVVDKGFIPQQERKEKPVEAHAAEAEGEAAAEAETEASES